MKKKKFLSRHKWKILRIGDKIEEIWKKYSNLKIYERKNVLFLKRYYREMINAKKWFFFFIIILLDRTYIYYVWTLTGEKGTKVLNEEEKVRNIFRCLSKNYTIIVKFSIQISFSPRNFDLSFHCTINNIIRNNYHYYSNISIRLTFPRRTIHLYTTHSWISNV